MPLPRPDKKNMQRLSMLYAAQHGKAGALDKLSDSSQATNLSEGERSSILTITIVVIIIFIVITTIAIVQIIKTKCIL